MTTTLPDGFSPKIFIGPERLSTSKHTKTVFIPEAAPLGMLGVDCGLYYPGSVPADQTISGNHSHVYIEGNLGANSKINVRQGIVSAHALEPGSEIRCGGIVVVEDMDASLSSLNVSERGREPLIIQVPSGKRQEVFLELVNSPQQSGQYEKRMAHLSDEAIDGMSHEEFRKHHDKAMGAYMGHDCWQPEVIEKALRSLDERGLIVATSRTARLATPKRASGEQHGR